MQYMGGKSRIAKDISQVILGHTGNREVYVEPFVGGGAMAEKLAPHFGQTIISDLHADLMHMWEAVINKGWLPPTDVSYESYQELRYSKEPSALRGFVGFGCSFGGRWFEGYARNGRGVNYALRASRVIARQAKSMAGATCLNVSFVDLPPVEYAPVIYCDPPYAGTKGYSTKLGAFPHTLFWEKARQWAESGADVYVSEYNAPDGWVPIWEKEVVGQLDLRKERTKPMEKLFVWEGTN